MYDFLSFQIRLQAVARLLSPVEISTSSMWGSSRVQGNAAVHLKLQSICYIPQESSKFILYSCIKAVLHDFNSQLQTAFNHPVSIVCDLSSETFLHQHNHN